MCYKVELQRKNMEKLNRKIDELELPSYMRKYFTVKIESKAAALNYLGVITNFLNWMIEEKIINISNISDIKPSDFSSVMAEDITLFLQTKEKNGMSPSTLETRKNIIRSFWNYLSRIKECDISNHFFDDVSYKGVSSNSNLLKKLPTEEQIRCMEEKIMWKKDIPVRNRNITIVKVLKGTGLRESELAGLDLSDVFLDCDMPYVKIIGKGVYREIQARPVYLTGSVCKTIKEWISYRNTLSGIVDKDALFVNKNGKRTTEDNIKAIFKNYGNGLTPHMMRHWYASEMVTNHSVNTVFVQQQIGSVIENNDSKFTQTQLGHSSSKTTVKMYANGAMGMGEILRNL